MGAIDIKEEKILSEKHTLLKEVRFSIQKKSGEWEEQTREVFSHGNAATALLYNPEKQAVVLTRQFRIATHLNGNSGGMLTETCAGLLEDGEEPDAAIKREIEEETGYKVMEVKKLFAAYSSPGAYTELVHYYLVSYSDSQKRGEGGGLEEEGEEVTVLEMPFEKAWQMLENGELKDAKTILLLQHLKLQLLSGKF